MIKKLALCLTAVSILLKIRFGHTQISLPKIVILYTDVKNSLYQPLQTVHSVIILPLLTYIFK